MKTFNIRNLRPGAFRYVPKNDRPFLPVSKPAHLFRRACPYIHSKLPVRSGEAAHSFRQALINSAWWQLPG
jgi:hypothetical protein